MRSTRQDTKDKRSRAVNARRNRNVTDGMSSEQRATQRKRDRREVERAVREGTETKRTASRARNARRNKNGTVAKERAQNERGGWKETYYQTTAKNSTKETPKQT